MKNVIISVAPVMATDYFRPEELAEDVKKCVDYGATICHMHCKDEQGKLTPNIDFMAKTFDTILEKTDIIVQASTGGISEMTIEERCNPLNYSKARSSSLNGGSTNLGEVIYNNSFEDIRYCNKAMIEKNISPEIEVFDIGMINNIHLLSKEMELQQPLIINTVFGHKGGMPATIEHLMAFRNFIPKNTIWGVTHFGRDNWQFLAGAIALGVDLVRIGFEDSPYLNKDENAKYNFQLVEKLSCIIKSMELNVASLEKAKEILNIK